MSKISRRGLLLGLSAGSAGLVTQAAAATPAEAKWGTGQLVSWNARFGYGLYQGDRGLPPMHVVLQRPFEPTAKLYQGARVRIWGYQILTEDGAAHDLQLREFAKCPRSVKAEVMGRYAEVYPRMRDAGW